MAFMFVIKNIVVFASANQLNIFDFIIDKQLFVAAI